MCGITGFYALKNERTRSELHVIGKKMIDSMAHRGPDNDDLWQDPDIPLVLAHLRLAIIDLTDDGAQPMVSASERYIIIYNGEIYNYLSIKKQLEDSGISFRGRSDTEVMLAAVEKWGLNRALQKFNGMFAFALWDRKNGELHFARDRMGKKPLYIGWAGHNLIFGSELKAVRTHPDFKAELNPHALQEFLSVGYVQAPHCIYKEMWQLPPGHRISLKLFSISAGKNLATQMKPFWNAAEKLEESKNRTNKKSEDEIINEFEDLLTACVADRLLSDVPLGAFLSGGIDSSSVVALMQKINPAPIKTYSIGFEDAGYNEAPHASAVANHLGTDHHEHMCTGQDALDTIPLLPEMYDEPFADISAIPTYLVSKFARNDVTVALSGDGGDEMLGGYSRHIQGPKIWNKMKMMPRIVRSGLSNVIQRVPVNALDSLNRKHPQIGVKLHKVASILSLDTQEEIYTRLTQKWPLPPLKTFEPNGQGLSAPDNLSFAEKMMFWDTVSYLPNDILTKVDRASMAVSLEVRAPLLDMRIYDYVWSLPENMKIRGTSGKWLLQQVLKRHVPENLFERPKQGFAMPVGNWLRGPLKDWAADLLDEKQLSDDGILDAAIIHKTWQSHLDGQGNHGEALWSVLMFRAWQKRWM